jgi:hypothetical protein
MKCHTNDNSTSSTQLPHKFSYIVAILGHNPFESPNILCIPTKNNKTNCYLNIFNFLKFNVPFVKKKREKYKGKSENSDKLQKL